MKNAELQQQVRVTSMMLRRYRHSRLIGDEPRGTGWDAEYSWEDVLFLKARNAAAQIMHCEYFTYTFLRQLRDVCDRDPLPAAVTWDGYHLTPSLIPPDPAAVYIPIGLLDASR